MDAGKSLYHVLFSVLFLTGCSAAGPDVVNNLAAGEVGNLSLSKISNDNQVYVITCGIESTTKKVSEFSDSIQKFIDSGYDLNKYRSILFEEKVILNRNSNFSAIPRDKIEEYSAYAPSKNDWIVIHKLVKSFGLNGGGWRGCPLGGGKAVFQADRNGDIRMLSFNARAKW